MNCENCGKAMRPCWEVFPIEFYGKKGWKVADEKRHKFFRLKKDANKLCTQIKKAGDLPALAEVEIHPGNGIRIIGGERKILNYKPPKNALEGAEIDRGKYSGWEINGRPFSRYEYSRSWLKKNAKYSYNEYLLRNKIKVE